MDRCYGDRQTYRVTCGDAVSDAENPLVEGAQGLSLPGGRLNKKDGLTRYGNSHVKDKTS